MVRILQYFRGIFNRRQITDRRFAKPNIQTAKIAKSARETRNMLEPRIGANFTNKPLV
jgi:hypothetical protein